MLIATMSRTRRRIRKSGGATSVNYADRMPQPTFFRGYCAELSYFVPVVGRMSQAYTQTQRT